MRVHRKALLRLDYLNITNLIRTKRAVAVASHVTNRECVCTVRLIKARLRNQEDDDNEVEDAHEEEEKERV
jgi:hypothetical protein